MFRAVGTKILLALEWRMKSRKNQAKPKQNANPKKLCDAFLHDNGRKTGFGGTGTPLLSDVARLNRCKVM